MRRAGLALLLTAALTAVLGVTAGPASAADPVRPNAAVADGELTSGAVSVLADPNNCIPHYLMTCLYTTSSTSITAAAESSAGAGDAWGGGTVASGTQLSKVQYAQLQADQPTTWSGLVSETRPNAATVPARQQAVDSTVAKVRRSANLLPSLKTRFGGVGTSARLGLQVTGWVAMAQLGLTGYAQAYELLTGDAGTTSDHVQSAGTLCAVAYCNAQATYWKHFTAGDSLYGVTNNGTGTPSGFYGVAPADGWYLNTISCQGASACALNSTRTAEPSQNISDTVSDPASVSYVAKARDLEAPFASWVTMSDNGTSKYWTKYLSDAQFENQFTSQPKSANDYSTYGGTKYVYTYAPTTIDRSSGAAPLGMPGSQTTAQKDTETAIARKTTPGSDPATGTGTGTGTSTGCGATEATACHQLQPQAGTVTPPTDCPCSVRGLDLAPLTTLDLGSRFPFGVFAWITGAIGLFDVTPVTPEVHFPMHLGDTSVHDFSDQDYHVTLAWWDPYMVIVRGLLTFFMWVSAIWFVATRFLKLDWAGQPSDGMDEVL